HGRALNRQGTLRLVPGSAPLRHRAARRLRARLRGAPRLRHGACQRARCDSVSAHAGECAGLSVASGDVLALIVLRGGFDPPVRGATVRRKARLWARIHGGLLVRTFIGRSVLAAAAVLLVGGAQAQEFPSRPITLMVGLAPGGITDITARLYAEVVARNLGQRI